MKLHLSFVSVSLLVLIGTLVHGAPTDLKSRPVPNRLGLTLNEYSLSWKDLNQRAFQVLVASDARKLAADVGDLWDSGRRSVGESSGVRCRGEAFPDGATIWWKVRTWSASGEGGEWSEASKIEVPRSDLAAKTVPRPSALSGESSFIDGKLGKAIEFGKGGTISVAGYDGLRSTEGTTFSAWIKPSQASDTWQCLYRKEDAARRLLAIGKEGPFWGLWCGLVIGGKYVEFGAPFEAQKLVDGNWHHVAGSFDGESIRLFVDGRKIGEQAARGKLSQGDSSAAYIGSSGGSTEWFRGGIDDFRIYEKGLGEKAIGELAAGKAEVEAGALAAHWKFDGTATNEAGFTAEVGRNRIVLLGGSLIYGMEKHGYFETVVSARWPHHDITFRNLGWPGDDVFGTARSEFGSAQNTRSWKPPGAEAGFGASERAKQVREARATTLIVGYGAEAAWADTEEKMRDFESGYRKLIDELEATGATLILLPPLPQADHPGVAAGVTERNVRLLRARQLIKTLAAEKRLALVDIPDEIALGFERHHGIQLSGHGYEQLAQRLVAGLCSSGGDDFSIGAVPDHGRGPLPFGVSAGVVSGIEKTKLGWRFDAVRDSLYAGSAMPFGRDEDFEVRIDGVRGNGSGPLARVLSHGPDEDQLEALRQTIVEKNLFNRHKIRPINKTYIFLFRRHEMGHLAYELDDFEERIEGNERIIANLRVPRKHSYEIARAADWKAPRDYPDHEVPKDVPAPDLEEELAAFTVADGFEVKLFASDPMIANPINLNWDTRGRAWVSTSSTYPHIKPGRIPNDRIVILEDTDGDGVADKHTVFADGLTVPHSVMPVTGGAYVCSTTEFLFLEDRDGDDVSESRRVIFSGFGNADVHHMIHGLRWAPWGDLHFTQSIYINSFVDTAYGPRRMNGSGVWRFRPEFEKLDAFAVGRVNPWGFTFDDWGQSFGTDGAGGAGPHYLFPGSAHRSAVGAHRVLDGLIPGKPKNTAAEFASGRHLPEHWQGSLLANDFRANRTVRYELQESGSGYTAKEVETVLHSSHRSFRPVDIKMGPEGAVYVVDWYNPIIDHGEVDFHHPLRDKSHGRIWRVTAKDRPLVERPQIAGAEPVVLLEMLKAPEQYTRTQANRELASRPCQGLLGPINQWIAKLDRADPNFEHHRLEGMWLLQAHRAGSVELVEQVLKSPDPHARAAAVRAVSNWQSRTAGRIDQLGLLADAIDDEHPRVRLEAVNALRRLGTLGAASVALRALDLPTDKDLDFALELTVRVLSDQWLPAMQAGKTVFDGEPSRLAFALKEVNDPRAMASLVEVVKRGELADEDLPNAMTTIAALGAAADIEAVLVLAKKRPKLLQPIADGAVRNAKFPAPDQAHQVASFLESDELATRIAAARLIGYWRVESAKRAIIEVAEAGGGESFAICGALAALGEIDTLRKFSADAQPAVLRAAAISAWASASPGDAAPVAVKFLQSRKDSAETESVFQAFLGHAAGPSALAQALGGSDLAEATAIAGVRATHASGRQATDLIAGLNAAGKLALVAQDLPPQQRKALLADAETKGDITRGREVFHRAALACTACHMIENQGGKLGPDLTTVGSYMTPDSLLESLLNPSSAIKQGYETAIITRKDNTVVSGLLQRKAENATLIRVPSGQVVAVPNSEIAKTDTSPVSLMPPGLTAQLRRDELVDLMKFLTTLGTAGKTR